MREITVTPDADALVRAKADGRGGRKAAASALVSRYLRWFSGQRGE